MFDPLLVYYSSPTLNTHRFAEKLGFRTRRIPISLKEEIIPVDEDYVLICPTYADDDGSKAVPKQVIHFLNSPVNRSFMRGVISSGNRNFGDKFAYAGNVISKKCGVPLLYKFELSGTPEDVTRVRKGMNALWKSLNIQTPMKKTGS